MPSSNDSKLLESFSYGVIWGIWKLEEISFFRIAFVMHQAEARDLSAKMEASLASGHCAQLEERFQIPSFLLTSSVILAVYSIFKVLLQVYRVQ